MSRTPFSGFMGGGSRQPQGGGQQPPPRAPYGGGDPYQQQQGYGARYNDPRAQQQPPQGYQGGGGQPRYAEKGPSGGGRQIPLRVEKVTDKSLQSRLIYGNLYVGALPTLKSSLTVTSQVCRFSRRLPSQPRRIRSLRPPPRWPARRRIRCFSKASPWVPLGLYQSIRPPAIMGWHHHERSVYRRDL